MGFGFNLLVIFVVLPGAIILLILWALTRKAIFGQFLKGGLITLSILFILVCILQLFTTKRRVEKQDIYGTYVIDRNQYPGPQAEWQYEHYRIKITRDDRLILYHTDGPKVNSTDTVKIKFLEGYVNDRIKLEHDGYVHHILTSHPTLYRQVWSFYYVFRSTKYGNMFFVKGEYDQ